MNVSPEHPEFDALSAHHDGEAPEWTAHVAGCSSCQESLGRLRAVAAVVGGPVTPVRSAVREDALARALQAFDNTQMQPDATESSVWHRGPDPAPAPAPALRPSSVPRVGPVRPPPERATPIASARSRRGRGAGMWVGVGSAAAVLMAFVLGIGVLTGGNGGGGGEDTTVAAGGPPAQQRSDASQESVGPLLDADRGGAGPAAVDTAGGADGGDLGDIADASALLSRARPALLQPANEATSDQPAPVAGITPSAEPAPTSKFVGTRPCEMQVRALRPDLGTVVYFATGRVQGAPVVVLGFAAAQSPTPAAPTPAPTPVTLLALAQQEGCRVVLEAVGP